MNKFCVNCGAQLKENELFCTNCGTRVKVKKEGINKKAKTLLSIFASLILVVCVFFLILYITKSDNFLTGLFGTKSNTDTDLYLNMPSNYTYQNWEWKDDSFGARWELESGEYVMGNKAAFLYFPKSKLENDWNYDIQPLGIYDNSSLPDIENFKQIIKQCWDMYETPRIDKAFNDYYSNRTEWVPSGFDIFPCYVYDVNDYNKIRAELDKSDSKGMIYLFSNKLNYSYEGTYYFSLIDSHYTRGIEDRDFFDRVIKPMDTDGIIEEAVIQGYTCKVANVLQPDGTHIMYYYCTDDYCIQLKNELINEDGSITVKEYTIWKTDKVTEEDVTSWSGEYYYYDCNYTGTGSPVYSIVRDGTKIRNGMNIREE
jgi:predicted nucleic acid-binding Zn ribbon protein